MSRAGDSLFRIISVLLSLVLSGSVFAESSCPPGGCLASPEDITLQGLERSYSGQTAIGKVTMRWPRKAENITGKQPERFLAEASSSIARVLGRYNLGVTPRNLAGPFEVVMLGEKLADREIPVYLMTSCHPGWMIPPAKIYLSPERIAEGCGSLRGGFASEYPEKTQRTFVHELAHAVEFELLGRKLVNDRGRAEGFASWLELLASRLDGSKETEGEYLLLAKASPRNLEFSGTAPDYARQALFFDFINQKFSTAKVRDIYRQISKDNLSLYEAADAVLPVKGKKLLSDYYIWLESKR